MTAYIHLHQKPKAASFTQLPNFLFEAPGFQPLSNGAKILYAMLLRRTDLSRKNGWADEYYGVPFFESASLLTISYVLGLLRGAVYHRARQGYRSRTGCRDRRSERLSLRCLYRIVR